MKELYEEDEDFAEIERSVRHNSLRKIFISWTDFFLMELVMYTEDLFREKVIRELHGGRLGGHFGTDKTIASIEKRYCWPQLGKDVVTIVSCLICQVAKGQAQTQVCIYPCPSPRIVRRFEHGFCVQTSSHTKGSGFHFRCG